VPESQPTRLVVTVELLLDGDREDFMRLVAENAATSLHDEPGCHQFDVSIDCADDRKVFLYEVYEGDAAFSAHLASPHYAAFAARTTGMIARKHVRRFWLKAG
jgi:quinol monooxygenase YgiN